MRRPLAAALSVVLLAGLAACGSDEEPEAAPSGSASAGAPSSAPASEPEEPSEPAETSEPAEPDADLDLALSEPREDSYYPEVGDPGVDALHYDLDLAWDPDTDTLTGTEVLTFRATETADRFRLDLGEPLEVTSLTLDGAEVDHEHTGKDLVVEAPVEADGRYELTLGYEGTPEPVDAPTSRGDFDTTGFTITADHETWTMQEPFGAYSWYAVNDQPSDKALYDFTLAVPSPWTGIANGEQTRSDDDGTTHVTEYHLAEPAASYLVTLAFGDYRKTDDEGPGGVPITYWTPRDAPPPDAGLRSMPAAMRWLERRLGPYPFDTAGILLVDSQSGMETQTMITLGYGDYATSPAVVLHELAHQWYGDQVTPNDWRDVWMNEGMAMYLQLMWQAEQDGVPLESYLQSIVPDERAYREEAGPPGDFDADDFASTNVYYGGALLWHSIRREVGDRAFWRAVKGWPRSQDGTSTDRETLLAYLEQQTGADLDATWDAWLLDYTSPPFPG
ncbi:M1 family metallopeptidase [Nocardioides marinquilinus]|uniref:Aminopeptidase N n=1 Tax=Nocardioides marinquilinus TaxID=1210400 RepID=A0ABP9P906_9ACTN